MALRTQCRKNNVDIVSPKSVEVVQRVMTWALGAAERASTNTLAACKWLFWVAPQNISLHLSEKQQLQKQQIVPKYRGAQIGKQPTVQILDHKGFVSHLMAHCSQSDNSSHASAVARVCSSDAMTLVSVAAVIASSKESWLSRAAGTGTPMATPG